MNAIFKQNYTPELLIVLKMVYSCFFGLRGSLDFPDFLQKKFYNINSCRSSKLLCLLTEIDNNHISICLTIGHSSLLSSPAPRINSQTTSIFDVPNRGLGFESSEWHIQHFSDSTTIEWERIFSCEEHLLFEMCDEHARGISMIG